jgi:RHS repeat-associated protein
VVAVGRLLSTELNNSAHATLNSHAYGYNVGSRRTNQVRADGSCVNYTYDSLGQLKTALGYENGGAARLHEKFGYLYDAAGNLSKRTNNALVQTFGVNNLNQLTTGTRSNTLTVAGTTTGPATNVMVKTSSQTNNVVPYADSTFAAPGFNLADGNNTFTAIAQDSLGRMDTNSVTVNLPGTVNFGYDQNGNLTGDGRRTFAYDDENQLVSAIVTNGSGSSTRSEFSYDGLFRRRVRKEYVWSSSSWLLTSECHYLYDGRLVVQERDASNLPAVTYTRGLDLSGSREGAGGIGGLLARTDHGSGQSAFYHADGNGNITALVNAQQLVVARYTYDPFGNTLSKSGPLADANLYRFSSKEYHEPSGLVYYLYRFYDPNLQRWLNRDPITELGFLLQQTGRQLFQGSKSDAPPVGVEDDDPDINQLLVGPGGLNAYGFNGNNAIIFVDYLGLAPFCVCVQADDDHAWISVTDLATGERHTYGRWKIGYPRNAPAKARSSGVNTDMELKRGFGASRCVTLQSFTPTINAGYDAYNNNCATYAWSEWKRASGENLDKSGISSGTFDYPSVLKDSILKKNGGKKEVGCCK